MVPERIPSTVLRAEDIEQLERNWTEQQPRKGTQEERDYEPVVKLFLPWTAGTWLITEKSPGEGLLFGLADLGFGTPELGYVSLDELLAVKGPAGLQVERDIHWTANMTLSEYADQSRKLGHIPA